MVVVVVVVVGGVGVIDTETKGCESIGCKTHVVTLDFDLAHDLDPGFSRSIFVIDTSQE